jgi:hypothetical protein
LCTSWVQTFDHTQSRCGATSIPTGMEIACIAGRLLAAEHSSEALVPFRDSSGSHCLAGAWVQPRHVARARMGCRSRLTPACARAPPSHETIMCRVPPSGHAIRLSVARNTGERGVALSKKDPVNSAFLDRVLPAPPASQRTSQQEPLGRPTRRWGTGFCWVLLGFAHRGNAHLPKTFKRSVLCSQSALQWEGDTNRWGW